MNKEIEAFLNNKTYILAYRSNYDSAREVNQNLIDYIKGLQQENNVLRENYKMVLKDWKEKEEELKEANDNATWWHNRFNALEKANKDLKQTIKEITCVPQNEIEVEYE